MKLSEIKKIIEGKVLWDNDYLGKEIKMACGSDLMSDVLAFIKPGSLLLTGLTNPQVVRTAEMAEIIAICFVRGKEPERETIELAKEKGISLLTSKCSMFESCGRLYKKGLPGCDSEE